MLQPFRPRFAFPVILVLLILCPLISGCGGVWMNATYSQLLDNTAAVANQAATRAEAGLLSEKDKTTILRLEATTWQRFQDARDNRAVAATQPAAK